MNNQHAIKNYNKTSLNFDDPISVVIQLLEGLMKSLNAAARAAEEEDVMRFHEKIDNSVEIVDCLHTGLDLSLVEESRLIKNLDSYYTNLFIKMNMISYNENPQEKILPIIDSVKLIRDKWKEFKINTHNLSAKEGNLPVQDKPDLTNIKC